MCGLSYPEKAIRFHSPHIRPVYGLTSEGLRTNWPHWATDSFAGRFVPAPLSPSLFAFMVAIPIQVTSDRLDSISAIEVMMWNIIFPIGVLVLMLLVQVF